MLALGALAALAVSNPALEVGKVDAGLLVDAGVAASRASAASILAAQPGHFRLHDFRGRSCPTGGAALAPGVEHAQDGPGSLPWESRIGGTPWARCARWATREIHAHACPLYLVAVGLASVAWAALTYFDAAGARSSDPSTMPVGRCATLQWTRDTAAYVCFSHSSNLRTARS